MGSILKRNPPIPPLLKGGERGFCMEISVDDPYEHFHPKREYLLIDVEEAAVVRVDDPLLLISTAQPKKGPWALLEVVGKILSAHRGF
jgi:hypothetical protein